MMSALVSRTDWVNGMPEVWTERLHLRLARPNEARLLHEYAVRNRARLEPWEATRPPRYYDPGFWNQIPAEDRLQVDQGLGARFRIFRPDFPQEVIGVVGLRDIVHREVQSGAIGYSIDGAYEGQGLMTEAVAGVIEFAFEYYNLHRLEACSMTTNRASRRVLEKLGFVNEGCLRESLRVAGKWEDHLIWSLLAREWRSRRGAHI